MYQIYVDRFRNGDPTNDVETNEYIYIGSPVQRVEDWDELPGTLDVGAFTEAIYMESGISLTT